MVGQRADLGVLAVIADAYDWDLGRLNELDELLVGGARRAGTKRMKDWCMMG